MADVHPEQLTLRISAPVAIAGTDDDAPPLSQRRLFIRRYCRHRLAVAGLIVFAVLLIFAFAGEPLWHYQYNVFTNALSQPPSLAHPFGTNTAGYDLLSQVLHGTQRSLEISLFVALVAGTFGSIWGAVAGLFGGRTDTLMMRFADLVLIFPILAIAAALANRFAQRANSWFFLASILAGLTWPYVSRLVRGVVLSLRERDFIVAARTYGASLALPGLPAPPAQCDGHDHRRHHDHPGDLDPRRHRAVLPRLRRPATRHRPRLAGQPEPVRDLRPALAVLLPRTIHRAYRAQCQLHRRRLAGRL